MNEKPLRRRKVLRRARWVALWSLAATLTFACGDDEPTGPGSAPNTADVAEYLGTLPTWGEYSPTEPAQDEPLGPTETTLEIVDGAQYECRTTPYSLTQTPDKVVTYDPDSNILWLGALLEGKGYKGGIGSLTELAIRERAPLTISIDLLAEENTRTIANPTLASVNQAIGELIATADAAGNRSGSSISFSQATTYSVNQAALKLGLSAGYMSVSVKALLEARRTAAERTITAHFVQRMFTVSVVLPTGPGDMFSPEFTQAKLDEQIALGHIGSDNPPVYVANIVYGRVLDFSLTSTEDEKLIRGALSASFGSLAETEIEAKYLNLLKESEIRVVTVGGEGKNALELIQNGRLRDYFKEDAALTSARPIAYTIRNLGNNSIARVSETTEYNLRECEAVPTTGILHVDVTPNDAAVRVKGAGGFDSGELFGDQVLRELEPGGYSVTVYMSPDPDSLFTVINREIDIAAGDSVSVPLTVYEKEQVVGEEYQVTLKGITVLDAGCTTGGFEGDPDVYYDISILNDNDQWLYARRAEDNAITLGENRFLAFDGSAASRTVTRRATLARRPGIRIRAQVWDSDSPSDDDLMANIDYSKNYPEIPTGLDRRIDISPNALGCDVRLHVDIVSLGEITGDDPFAGLPVSGRTSSP